MGPETFVDTLATVLTGAFGSASVTTTTRSTRAPSGVEEHAEVRDEVDPADGQDGDRPELFALHLLFARPGVASRARGNRTWSAKARSSTASAIPSTRMTWRANRSEARVASRYRSSFAAFTVRKLQRAEREGLRSRERSRGGIRWRLSSRRLSAPRSSTRLLRGGPARANALARRTTMLRVETRLARCGECVVAITWIRPVGSPGAGVVWALRRARSSR